MTPRFNLQCRGEIVSLSTPCVMGILNLTPDSFFDGGKYTDPTTALKRAEKMLEAGARFVDVGAASSRPGAELLAESDEWARLEPVLQGLQREFPQAYISVDTWRAGIAQRAVERCGVCMINDISGGLWDTALPDMVARLGVAYVLMHTSAQPAQMQLNTGYENTVKDIMRFLSERILILHEKGIHDYLIDPGFGFGKTLEQNYEILSRLNHFQIFDAPILVGLSRKSMIYNRLNCTPDQALNGTTALHMAALMKGARVLRAHDVKEACETIRLWQMLNT